LLPQLELILTLSLRAADCGVVHNRQRHEYNAPACACRSLLLLWLVWLLLINGLWQVQLLEKPSEVGGMPAGKAKQTMWVQGQSHRDSKRC
jgi:hypothetical protein